MLVGRDCWQSIWLTVRRPDSRQASLRAKHRCRPAVCSWIDSARCNSRRSRSSDEELVHNSFVLTAFTPNIFYACCHPIDHGAPAGFHLSKKQLGGPKEASMPKTTVHLVVSILPPEKNLSGLHSRGHGYVLPICQYSFCKNSFVPWCLFHFL